MPFSSSETGGLAVLAPPSEPPRAVEATRWSQIDLLCDRGTTEASQKAWHEAWQYLFTAFQPALENQVRRVLRRHGFPEGEAEDVVQAFWAECVEKNRLSRADRTIGRFRTFARVCVRRFTSKYIAARRTQRRAPRTPLRSLSLLPDAATPAPFQPLTAFEGDWERCQLIAAIRRVAGRSQHNALRLCFDFALDATLIERSCVRDPLRVREDPCIGSRAYRMLREEMAWIRGQGAA